MTGPPLLSICETSVTFSSISISCGMTCHSLRY
jgi:hypothetical protein